MSNIFGLAVLTLGLGRTDLLKENVIRAELPFPKQKPRLNVAPSIDVSLLPSAISALNSLNIHASSQHRAAQALRRPALTCASFMPCNKVRRVGWLRVMCNKACMAKHLTPRKIWLVRTQRRPGRELYFSTGRG